MSISYHIQEINLISQNNKTAKTWLPRRKLPFLGETYSVTHNLTPCRLSTTFLGMSDAS